MSRASDQYSLRPGRQLGWLTGPARCSSWHTPCGSASSHWLAPSRFLSEVRARSSRPCTRSLSECQWAHLPIGRRRTAHRWDSGSGRMACPGSGCFVSHARVSGAGRSSTVLLLPAGDKRVCLLGDKRVCLLPVDKRVCLPPVPDLHRHAEVGTESESPARPRGKVFRKRALPWRCRRTGCD